MLNNRKIRLMTKLAIYETKEGKDDIKLGKYYRLDYVRFQLLKTIIAVTVGYLIVVLMLAMYRAEYLIAEAVKLDYATIGKNLLGIYIVVELVFVVATVIGYTLKYNISRKKLAKYYKMLKKLRSMYGEEGEHDTGDEAQPVDSDIV